MIIYIIFFQEDTVSELGRSEDSAFSTLESMTKYFVSRAKLVSKVSFPFLFRNSLLFSFLMSYQIMKYPEIEDYKRSIGELDEKELINLRLCALDLRNTYAILVFSLFFYPVSFFFYSTFFLVRHCDKESWKFEKAKIVKSNGFSFINFSVLTVTDEIRSFFIVPLHNLFPRWHDPVSNPSYINTLPWIKTCCFDSIFSLRILVFCLRWIWVGKLKINFSFLTFIFLRTHTILAF